MNNETESEFTQLQQSLKNSTEAKIKEISERKKQIEACWILGTVVFVVAGFVVHKLCRKKNTPSEKDNDAKSSEDLTKTPSSEDSECKSENLDK